jgi:hypothetical protein
MALTTREKYAIQVRRKQWADKRGIVFGGTSAPAVSFLPGTATFTSGVRDTRFLPKTALLHHNSFTADATAACPSAIETLDVANPIHHQMTPPPSTPRQAAWFWPALLFFITAPAVIPLADSSPALPTPALCSQGAHLPAE